MNTFPRQLFLFLAAGLLATGCSLLEPQVPTLPTTQSALGISANQGLLYVGDPVHVTNKTGAEFATLEIENTLQPTHKKSFQFNGPFASQPVVLDAEHLPGLDDALVQTYRFRLSTSQGASTTVELNVAKDRTIQEMPNVPYQFGGNVPPGSRNDTYVASSDPEEGERFVRQILSDWSVSDLKLVSQTVSPAAADIPPTFGPIPQGIRLALFTAEGKFGRYFIPASYTSSGVAEVLTPSKIQFLVCDTTPAKLIRFRISP